MKALKRALIYLSLLVFLIFVGYLAYKLMLPEEKKNILRRKIQNYTGFNLTVTVYSYDGKIIKQWKGVSKVTSGHQQGQYYVYFYTKDGKYVQIPHSALYIAEEE